MVLASLRDVDQVHEPDDALDLLAVDRPEEKDDGLRPRVLRRIVRGVAGATAEP
jgi:hypothetical protein